MHVKIYVDSACHCHLSNSDQKFHEVETDFFDGKCEAFVEGYCYCESEDGVAIYAWKPYEELDQAQRQYERELAEAARILMGEVSV